MACDPRLPSGWFSVRLITRRSVNIEPASGQSVQSWSAGFPRLARLRHAAMPELSPLSGVMQKSHFRAAKTGFDPDCVKTFFLPQKLHATGTIRVDTTV